MLGIFVVYIDDSIMLYYGWIFGEVFYCFSIWVIDNVSGDRFLEVEGVF